MSVVSVLRRQLYVSVLALGAVAASAPPPGAPTGGVTMDQAVRRVEAQFHARVVKAEAQQSDGHTVYVLRLLNESGKVWTVHVDASSGTVQ
ncbi:MAG: PepSY domain-containing protein [Gammaproteobacteria bacterium]|nr:PepSY domain-containing protein [Gammaproteobacteria bacterium]